MDGVSDDIARKRNQTLQQSTARNWRHITKMLTQTLRGLEREGLVSRKVYATVPPKVEYSLTPLGHTLKDLLYAVKSWSETNIKEVLDAQRSYDELNLK